MMYKNIEISIDEFLYLFNIFSKEGLIDYKRLPLWEPKIFLDFLKKICYNIYVK